MPEQRRRIPWSIWLIGGLLVVLLVVALAIWWRPIHDFASDEELIQHWIERLGAWGPIAIIALEMLQTFVAPIPGQAIEAASGYLFGPWWGTLYAMIGKVIGSLIIFLLAKRFGRPLAIRLAGQDSVARLDDLARRGGAVFFFLIWLFPLAPDDLACVAAGLTPMPTQQFLILMTLGRLPGAFAAVLVGAKATEINPLWWGVFFVAITLAALVVWRWGDHIQDGVLSLLKRLGNRQEE
jgi:uncharacterized membrane protein YdjX (TVP38/TMEM64 family)